MAPPESAIPEENASDTTMSVVTPEYTGANEPAVKTDSGGKPEYNSAPPLKRSVTTESRLSRIASKLPNHEATIAKIGNRGQQRGGPPGGGPPGGGPPGGGPPGGGPPGGGSPGGGPPGGGPPGGGRPGGPPGGGPPGRPPPKLQKFSHEFWSPEFTFFRKLAFKILGRVLLITTLVMWAAVSFYYGSLWKANHLTHQLAVRVIDRDGGEIGSAVSGALLNMTTLRFFRTSPTELPTMADVEHDIVEEGAWASIVINPGATANLAAARAAGDASYLGSSAITVVYAQARQENAVGSYLLPAIEAALGSITAKISAQSLSDFLAANSANATALALVTQAPTTLSSSVFYALDNVRPYNQPVAQAITLVGLIYMLIFSFICTMANSGVREIIAPYLSTRSYLMYRIFAPLTLYGWLSFVFAMVNLPFKVDFGAHFTYGGGFFFWWFATYLGMAAVGFATEWFITVVGPKFMSFGLIPLIIANVSSVSLPHELQPWIYRYGAGMPFFNCSRIVRTLIFNTKDTLGLNIGILFAWVALSIVTITLSTLFYRRVAQAAHDREVGEHEADRKLPDGRVV